MKRKLLASALDISTIPEKNPSLLPPRQVKQLGSAAEAHGKTLNGLVNE